MKTEKQIALQNEMIGKALIDEVPNENKIYVDDLTWYKYAEVMEKNKLDVVNLTPLFSDGVVISESEYNNATTHYFFSYKPDDEKLVINLSLVTNGNFVFKIKVTVDRFFDIKTSGIDMDDYFDATVVVYRKQHRKEDEINRYVDTKTELIENTVNNFMQILLYINYLLEHPEIKEVHKEKTSPSTASKKASVSKSSTPTEPGKPVTRTTLINGLRIVSDAEQVHKKLKSKKIQRITDCWGVRGHYRHYKNGKTVYIEPYKKGKGRNEKTAAPKSVKVQPDTRS